MKEAALVDQWISLADSEIGAYVALVFQLCKGVLPYTKPIHTAFLERAIRGLKTVEAGAQGEHKLARGYAPVATYSAHYIPDPNFRRAIADYLVREREAVAEQQEYLGELTPFRRGEQQQPG